MAADDFEKGSSRARSAKAHDHPGLTEQDVIARGGWHPRYTRVLATASDGEYGFALVDGNGDGAELEAETWTWQDGSWVSAGSSGVGPLGHLGPRQTGGQIGNAYFTYGSAPGRQSISINFDGGRHQVPVSRHGVWAFIKRHTDASAAKLPASAAWRQGQGDTLTGSAEQQFEQQRRRTTSDEDTPG